MSAACACPPRIAPIQIVIVPVAAHKGGVTEKCDEVYKTLTAAGFRVKLDDRDTVSPGYKFNDWELKGVPVRLEIGPRDIENHQVMAFRRDTFDKFPISFVGLTDKLGALLDEIQQNLFRIAAKLRDEHITVVKTMDELNIAVQTGFAKTMWCGDAACEEKIKQEFNATSRNMPFDQTPVGETCVCCGKKADKLIYFAKAY